MSFSFLTVPLVSGGWGCSSQINEVFGVLPSTPAETITLGEYDEASQPKNEKQIHILGPITLVDAICSWRLSRKNNIQGRNN